MASAQAPLEPAPDRDARHLERVVEVERVGMLVRWLDDLVRIPGTKFGIGLDPLVGLIPGVGDLASSGLSLTVLAVAMRRGVPRVVLVRMLANIAIDTLVGMIPVAGDVFDVLWRSNVRNLELLERHQGEVEPRARAGDYAILGVGMLLLALAVAVPIVLAIWLLGLLGCSQSPTSSK